MAEERGKLLESLADVVAAAREEPVSFSFKETCIRFWSFVFIVLLIIKEYLYFVSFAVLCHVGSMCDEDTY